MSTEEELVHLRNLVAKKDHTILELQEQIEWFQRQVFGTKSERTILPTNQQDIFGNDQESNEQSKPKTHTIAQHERKIKGHGRNEIPDTLDEEIILVEVNESDRI